MTRVGYGDTVVYEVAICEHPVTAHEEDEWDQMLDDADLVNEANERTHVEGMDFPEWTVFYDDPPDAPLIRYVNTATRINIKVRYEECDPFAEIFDRVTIDGWDRWEDREADMSHWGATHIDDFEGDIHLDLTG